MFLPLGGTVWKETSQKEGKDRPTMKKKKDRIRAPTFQPKEKKTGNQLADKRGPGKGKKKREVRRFPETDGKKNIQEGN